MKKETRERMGSFFESKAYIALVGLLVLLGHTSVFNGAGELLLGGYQEFLFGGLIILSICLACLVCTDIRFLIMPVISFVFLVTVEHSPNVPSYSKFYLEPIPLVIISILAALLGASLVFFCVKNRYRAKKLPWKNKGFLGMAIFCGVMLVNGAFCEYYTVANALYPLSFLLSMLGVYALFACYMRFNETAFSYFMTCVFALSLLIASELLLAYLTGGVLFEEGSVVKESVVLGWGVWTAIGGMLVFLMPVCFWFAHSHKHGWIFYLLGFLEYACILLSQSRGALLFGTGVLGLSLLMLCVSGKNRKSNRILTAVVALAGVCGVLLLWDKLMGVLQNYIAYGMDDNGRFDLWKIGWKNFTDYPILGAGYYNSFAYEGWQKDVYPYLYHNTLLQLMASGGVLLLGAYLYHRFTTIMLVIKKPNANKIFLGICLLGLLSFSLLDVLFFNTYPTIIYSIMILFMDREYNERQAD